VIYKENKFRKADKMMWGYRYEHVTDRKYGNIRVVIQKLVHYHDTYMFLRLYSVHS